MKFLFFQFSLFVSTQIFAQLDQQPVSNWLEKLPAGDTLYFYYQVGGCESPDSFHWLFFKKGAKVFVEQKEPYQFVGLKKQPNWVQQLCRRELDSIDVWIGKMQRLEFEGGGSTAWEECSIWSKKDSLLNWELAGGRPNYKLMNCVFAAEIKHLERQQARFSKKLNQKVQGFWQPEFSKKELDKTVLRRVSNLDSARLKGPCIWHFDKKNVFRMLPTNDCPAEKTFKWPTKFEWYVRQENLYLEVKPDYRRMEWGEFEAVKSPYWEVEFLGESEILLRFLWE